MTKKGGKIQPKPVDADSEGAIGGIKTNFILPLLGNVRTYVIAAIVAGILGVASYLIHAADSQIKNYLAAAVSEKLNDEITKKKQTKEEGPLYSAISKAVGNMREFEVGGLNAGRFVLSPSNPTYQLTVYTPEKDYIAKLYYQVKDINPNCQLVELAFAGQQSELPMDEHSLDLNRFFEVASAQARQNADFVDRGTASRQIKNNLHVITFQLKGHGVALQANDLCAHILQQIDITYATLVAPTIHIGQ
jgi:hypothetical protein